MFRAAAAPHGIAQARGHAVCFLDPCGRCAGAKLLLASGSVETVDRLESAEAVEVLRPGQEWEGAHLPLAPSYRGAIGLEVSQVRDPAIFEEDSRIYLVYAVKGETGIAIAELIEQTGDSNRGAVNYLMPLPA